MSTLNLPNTITLGRIALALVVGPMILYDGFAVRLASGGHPYPILLRADGTIERGDVAGPMLGAVESPRLEEAEIRLAPGDTLVLYTDGVIDARRPGGELYG